MLYVSFDFVIFCFLLNDNLYLSESNRLKRLKKMLWLILKYIDYFKYSIIDSIWWNGYWCGWTYPCTAYEG